MPTTFAVCGPGDAPGLEPFLAALEREWARRGHVRAEAEDATVIFNVVDPARPKPFRRRRRATYVVMVTTAPERPANVIKHVYPMMVRSLVNLGLLFVPGD